MKRTKVTPPPARKSTPSAAPRKVSSTSTPAPRTSDRDRERVKSDRDHNHTKSDRSDRERERDRDRRDRDRDSGRSRGPRPSGDSRRMARVSTGLDQRPSNSVSGHRPRPQPSGEAHHHHRTTEQQSGRSSHNSNGSRPPALSPEELAEKKRQDRERMMQNFRTVRDHQATGMVISGALEAFTTSGPDNRFHSVASRMALEAVNGTVGGGMIDTRYQHENYMQRVQGRSNRQDGFPPEQQGDYSGDDGDGGDYDDGPGGGESEPEYSDEEEPPRRRMPRGN